MGVENGPRLHSINDIPAKWITHSSSAMHSSCVYLVMNYYIGGDNDDNDTNNTNKR